MKRKLTSIGLCVAMVATMFLVAMNVNAAPVRGELPTEEFVTDENTVALWHFNEGQGSVIGDSSGNDYDGTLYYADWTSGIFGNALSFYDRADVVNYIPASFDDDIGDSLTVEVMVKWNGHHPNNPYQGSYIMDARDLEGERGGFILFLDPAGLVKFYAGHDTGPEYVISENPIPIGEWTHVAVVLDHDASELRVYINGLEDSFAVANSPYNDIDYGRVAIGNNRYGTPGGDRQHANFNGVIDELRVSNTVRYGGNQPPVAVASITPGGSGVKLANVEFRVTRHTVTCTIIEDGVDLLTLQSGETTQFIYFSDRNYEARYSFDKTDKGNAPANTFLKFR
ncbi:MAG: LamG domain-containing protein, partial [Thermoplasmata archaeon]|nr:LamG domain-containing protein [Thermoplasmata archaeon]